MREKIRFGLLEMALCIALAPLAAGASSATENQTSEVTFRTSVEEVRVVFSATDPQNRLITKLDASQFAVIDEDRVVREFRSFGLSDYTRVEVAVLMDASGSISRQSGRELMNEVGLVANSGLVPNEALSILSFRDKKTSLICRGNCAAIDLSAAIPEPEKTGLTPLYDSVVFASRMLGERADDHTRKIIVLFSDGEDNISLNSLSDAVEAAAKNDVAIYCADAGDGGTTRGNRVLRAIAGVTGGLYFSHEASAAQVLDAIKDNLHSSYTVSYKLPNHAEGFHLVRILPTHDLSLQFHCRRGYYYSEN